MFGSVAVVDGADVFGRGVVIFGGRVVVVVGGVGDGVVLSYGRFVWCVCCSCC